MSFTIRRCRDGLYHLEEDGVVVKGSPFITDDAAMWAIYSRLYPHAVDRVEVKLTPDGEFVVSSSGPNGVSSAVVETFNDAFTRVSDMFRSREGA